MIVFIITIWPKSRLEIKHFEKSWNISKESRSLLDADLWDAWILQNSFIKDETSTRTTNDYRL